MNSFLLDFRAGELLKGVQDVAFLPSHAWFCTTFLKNCGRCEGLMTTKCLRTVVGGNQGHAPYKILLLHKACVSQILWRSLDFYKDWVKSRLT